MKKIIKKVIKIFINDEYIKKYKYAIERYYKKYRCIKFKDKIKCFIFDANKYKFYKQNNISQIFNRSKGNVMFSKYFSYFIDFYYVCEDSQNYNHNMTPDYSVILEYSLNDLKKIFKENKKVINFINEIELYLEKYILRIKATNFKNKDEVIEYINNIKNKKCESLKEGLQRILFFNQIFWQLGYKLCGLGRLDYILDRYYKKENDAEEIICDFFNILNNYFDDKSGCLSGDTGQIIILGGKDEEGDNFCNDLTYLFIAVLKKYNKPDPKILLRVNKKTDEELLKLAVDCMATGVGSPLLSNDDIIITRMIDFGYEKKDSFNYVTAACWEPSPCGNSIDLNNAITLNLLQPFNQIFEGNYEFINIEDLLSKYFINLEKYIKNELEQLSHDYFDGQPYLSLFIKNCRESGEIIGNCDVKYKNIGITTLGVSNVVNSILNIKFIVEIKKIMKFSELNELRKNNFLNEDILDLLHYNNKFGYGSNSEEAIELTNTITKFISNEFKKYKTYYGGNFKFGLSAPSYVELGKNEMASFDGRKNNEPLNVHISSTQNTFLEIMDFASKIEYRDNGINGNVIDFIVSPTYIKNNIEKFTNYLQKYIEKGIYQLQINVIDSKTLLEAKKNPNLYKNLIVRVWGFSAYFNDLPEEYKDLLISRAIEAERANS